MELNSLFEDQYLSYFFTRPFWQTGNLFLLGLARIIPIVGITPFLGARILTLPMKIFFSISITFIFFPFMLLKSTEPLILDMQFAFLLFKEVLIGAMMGFIISIPFFYAQAAGALIDHQRGAQSLQVTDPSTQTQSSPLGLFYGNVILVIFFLIGGHFLFFDALFTSYDLMPIDRYLPESFFSTQNPLWFQLISMFHDLLKMSMQLAAPALIAILMSDLFLGIANRMAPQVQISFLLMSLKAFVGLLILWFAWGLVIKQMEIQSAAWFRFFHKLISQMGIF